MYSIGRREIESVQNGEEKANRDRAVVESETTRIELESRKTTRRDERTGLGIKHGISNELGMKQFAAFALTLAQNADFAIKI